MKGELTLNEAISLAKVRNLSDPEAAQVICLDRDFPGHYLVCSESEFIYSNEITEADIVCFFYKGKKVIP